MTPINCILARRKLEKRYDEELWDFMGDMMKRPLQNLDGKSLQLRLGHLEKNIQYLDVGPTNKDELPPERGWLSPWWWLRLRHWTLQEMKLRSIAPLPPKEIQPMRPVREAFAGVHGGGKLQLFRISRAKYLIETVETGRLRFAPASSYKDFDGDEARADDELRKSYHRPGQNITITHQSGKEIKAIGDVTHSFTRTFGDQQQEVPYWLTSYSTDLDPRLISEFPSGHDDDAVLAIFDLDSFLKRVLVSLEHVAPYAEKALTQVNYYDAYNPPTERFSPLEVKEMPFAYQREIRMLLDPGLGKPLANGDDLFVDVGSLADIAAVYAPDGSRIIGSGPDSFFE